MKKTTSSKWILLVSILALAVVAGVPMAFAEPPSDLTNVAKPNALEVNEPVTFESPKGAAGSGWKPDTAVASGTTSELDTSMGSYVDPGTGAVTLYVAYVWWVSASSRYEGRLARSLNQGSTWSTWWSFWWGGHHIDSPSLVVNAYNNTVFIATERYPTAGGDREIDVWRFEPGYWTVNSVDTDADDDRYPSLTIEYSYATNYLFVSYEKLTTSDDRDLYVARSTNWGVTWTITLLHGGIFDFGVYAQSDATYAQGNVYIAYRHSTDWSTTGHIDVTYSTDYGGTWNHVYNVSKLSNDASQPSIAGSHIGSWHKPATVMIAYDYTTTTTNHDVLYTWTVDYGATWTGGNDTWHKIAATADNERFPKLTVDGMGSQSTNVGGNFHLVYYKHTGVSEEIRYTQLQYWDTVPYRGGQVALRPYFLGWSSPHGLINDNAADPTIYNQWATITTYTRTVGSDTLWEPAVAWADSRDFLSKGWDIYYSTPGTDFRITFFPSSQTVVAGKSISYYVTVNLLGGSAATAYLDASNSLDPHRWITYWYRFSFTPSSVTPTATSVLTIDTSNFLSPGSYSLNITATIGGYRRIVAVPFTVTSKPSLTLDLNPTTVARGADVTISGQLSPAPGAPTTIYLYYRFPHQTGSWALATTISTNAAGTYSVTATIPMSLTPGDYDLVSFWVNTNDGSYATSPIKVLTITP